MISLEQKQKANAFINKWSNLGNEKQHAQQFWNDLLGNVLGIPQNQLSDYIQYERKVGNKFIDGYIPSTKILIEHKSRGVDLEEKKLQSDGQMLTPYEQAKRYLLGLGANEHPHYIITSNFAEVYIYDEINDPQGTTPYKISLQDLKNQKDLNRLSILIGSQNVHLQEQFDLTMQAGVVVGKLYNALSKQYQDIENNKKEQESLNILIVRLVFLLYAEDADVLDDNQFLNYIEPIPADQLRRALIDLFEVLDTPEDPEDPEVRKQAIYYLPDNVKEFPYVNGGLFTKKDILICNFTDEIKQELIDASSALNWADIDPTIFGGVFESTLNPETRRSGGMHYTSIENIEKIINPLFMDDLNREFENILKTKTKKNRIVKLHQFQDKLASIRILDPACGSGNFLTQSFLALRELENLVLLELSEGRASFDLGEEGKGLTIKVTISQFYGIEINDFAVSVAKTALWIADSQMKNKTSELLYREFDLLPLTKNDNIIKENALAIDWNDLLDKSECSYVIGNPPFIGSSHLTAEQKQDRACFFDKNGGELDYVACWYAKAAEYMKGTQIISAFVSTNSITQGQQVAPLWDYLFKQGIHINFAYRTFVWNSKALDQAHVYVVIIAFSYIKPKKPTLFESTEVQEEVENINGYLIDGKSEVVVKRRKPISKVPTVIKGLQPTDRGYLLLDEQEKNDLVEIEPNAEKWIRPFITAREYLYSIPRYCLWLEGITAHELAELPHVRKRVELCREWRSQQVKTGDAYKLKDKPHLLRPSSKFKETDMIFLPRHTGEKRRYIPFGFIKAGAIPGDSASVILDADLYLFGILTSQFHNAWMRTVAGRLKGDYRYTSDIVYNTFVFPTPTQEQKQEVERLAQDILNIRASYSDWSLADLYDPEKMPYDLKEKHLELDRLVERIYGVVFNGDEEKIVKHLFKLYSEQK